MESAFQVQGTSEKGQGLPLIMSFGIAWFGRNFVVNNLIYYGNNTYYAN